MKIDIEITDVINPEGLIQKQLMTQENARGYDITINGKPAKLILSRETFSAFGMPPQTQNYFVLCNGDKMTGFEEKDKGETINALKEAIEYAVEKAQESSNHMKLDDFLQEFQ